MSLINNALVRMMTAVTSLRERARSERGQDLMEYALLGGLIAALFAAGGAILLLTGALEGAFQNVVDCLNGAATCGP